jgi:serine/threonine protein kinase
MNLKRRQRLGQYRIEAHLSTGGFANVYRAYDTVEGIRVAIKLPHERMKRRMSRSTALYFGEQLMEALAFAHRHKIAHLDVKPENLIVFSENRLRLADFGLARVVLRTLAASGSGTVGYLAPEQALGKPSLRSDVFSAGLILWRLYSGKVPEWPFSRPYPGLQAAERKYHPALLRFVRRATAVDETKRFPTAVAMLAAYRKLGKRKLL